MLPSSESQYHDHDVWIEARRLPATMKKIRHLSMLPSDVLIDVARLVRTVIALNIPGDFVECGVWRGGTAFLMAELLRQAGINDRKVWLFDSFEGLPPPSDVDGEVARRFVAEKDSPYYYRNYSASLEEVKLSATRLGLISHTEMVKGWFDQTLPIYQDQIGDIAILRVDCDWHDSIQCCLENLYDKVPEGGFVSLDDYYYCDGAARAVHEFLGKYRLPHRIERPFN